jgi:hypothetical protein
MNAQSAFVVVRCVGGLEGILDGSDGVLIAANEPLLLPLLVVSLNLHLCFVMDNMLAF